ncbi:MAG: hypothetical protein GYB36_00870 [Alphaproteobacteria bacterium]|nr:hypothetical protein [Alphaproteobacteria bacterium]
MRIPSLPDWAFYPFTAMIISGLIGGAILIGADDRPLEPEEIREFGYVYEGQALQGLTIGPGLTADYLTEGAHSFARIAAARGPLDGVPHGGAFFALTSNQIEAFRGYELIITATLRSATTDGAETVQLNLFAGGRNQGDWETFELQDQFEEIVFRVSPPNCQWEQGRSLMAFWPASNARANTIDLERVAITVADAQDCS